MLKSLFVNESIYKIMYVHFPNKNTFSMVYFKPLTYPCPNDCERCLGVCARASPNAISTVEEGIGI